MKKPILLLTLVHLWLAGASAAEVKGCGSLGSAGADSIRFCERENPSSDTLLVFLHGVGSTEERLFGSNPYPPLGGVEVNSLPSVLSLSFGRFRFLAGNANIEAAARLIEDRVQAWRARRPHLNVVLLGDSMGGFNGLQILLRRPDAFDRVALICPAITATSPYADNATWDADPDYVAANSLYRFGYRRALWLNFGDEKTWNESEPLSYLRQNHIASTRHSALLLATVAQDEYGFIHAHDILAGLLESNGFTVAHVTEPGATHCHVNPDALANFLLSH